MENLRDGGGVSDNTVCVQCTPRRHRDRGRTDSYLLQTSTEPGMRGRLFALHESTYGGVMQASYVLTGVAYARIGIPHAGIVVGAMSLLCGASWLWQFGAGAVIALCGSPLR